MYKCWSLYNKEEQLRVDELSIDQVRVILLSIPAKKLSYWYAMSEGDQSWVCITEIDEFYEDTRQPRGKDFVNVEQEEPPKPKAQPASRRPLFEEAPDSTEATLKLEVQKAQERRTARRYVRNLKFKCTDQGMNFECPTVDVSMGGFALKDPLPATFPKKFRATLSLKDDHLTVNCMRVSETQIKIIEASSWELLRHWLISW